MKYTVVHQDLSNSINSIELHGLYDTETEAEEARRKYIVEQLNQMPDMDIFEIDHCEVMIYVTEIQ